MKDWVGSGCAGWSVGGEWVSGLVSGLNSRWGVGESGVGGRGMNVGQVGGVGGRGMNVGQVGGVGGRGMKMV